ncbi:hypothetical protein COCMIDRAFT_29182 [Bipolaris oryzae ATCC 44560]|uniref:Uncharacterized protein n=1 Tax=Bipolaris oryzae ATCC 44560 TaxID=930090 RepID=W6YRU9_COCMI|nr:uncharacterized protein COCMIDRAFT_29182 [Bipolaris oryzae ATCC 44560]EUC42162.1 hypothetical protein COCMIDRAFT_29182 [Bipolaris oryzae ATCC 44560]
MAVAAFQYVYAHSFSFLFFFPLPHIPGLSHKSNASSQKAEAKTSLCRSRMQYLLSPDYDQPLWAATVATIQGSSSTRLKLIALWKLAIHISNFAGCNEELTLQPVLHAEPLLGVTTIISSMPVRVARSNELGQNLHRHRSAMFQPDKAISSYGDLGTVGWHNSTPPAHGKSYIHAANAFQSPAAFRLPDFVSEAPAPRSHILVNRGNLFLRGTGLELLLGFATHTGSPPSTAAPWYQH